jgi:hypothetical protein
MQLGLLLLDQPLVGKSLPPAHQKGLSLANLGSPATITLVVMPFRQCTTWFTGSILKYPWRMLSAPALVSFTADECAICASDMSIQD